MTFQHEDSRLRPGSRIDPGDLVGQRWFGAPDQPIRSIVVEDRFDLPSGGALAILRMDVEGGGVLRRSIPIETANGRGPWIDLLELAIRGGSLSSAAGAHLVGTPAPEPPREFRGSVRPLGKDQSHTSVVIDDSVVLKLYRALTPSPNPEVELGAALAPDPGAPVPTFRGAVEVRLPAPPPSHSHTTFALAFVQDYVPDAGDAFETLADRLAAWLTAGAPPRALPSLVADGQPAGRATARLHASLARAFPTRAARPDDIGRWRQRAVRAHRAAVFRIRSVDPARATWLVEHRPAIEAALAPLADTRAGAEVAADADAARTLQRIHADLHLGQLLRDGYQFLIADLEGEPTRPVAERRRLDTPLRDLASMLRSFDHVARSGMRRSGVPLDEVAAGTSAADPAIEAWLAAVRSAFLDAYVEESAARGRTVEIDRSLLHALEVEKELYEFSYAATYLPAWRYAPAAGMRWLLRET